MSTKLILKNQKRAGRAAETFRLAHRNVRRREEVGARD